MIHLETSWLWWIFSILIVLALLYFWEKAHEKYVMPTLFELQDIIIRLDSWKNKVLCYLVLLVLLLCYLFCFINIVCFLVKFVMEAEISWFGLMCYAMVPFIFHFSGKCLKHIKSGLER